MSAYTTLVLSESNLLNYWELQETVGTSAVDAKSALNGTYQAGCTLNQSAPSALGASVAFDGTSSGLIAVPTESVASPFSIEFWYKSAVADAAQNGGIIVKQPINAQWEILIFSNNFVFRGSASGDNFSTPFVSDNAWHHIAISITGTTGIWYFDGAAIASVGSFTATANGTTSGANDLVIGSLNGFGFNLKGNMAHVALYSALIPHVSVANHYNFGSTGSDTPGTPPVTSYSSLILSESSLINYWQLQDSAFNIATDSKGSNHGIYRSGCTLAQSSLARLGSSVLFSGTSSGQVVIPTESISGDLSIEFWYKVAVADLNQNGAVIGKQPHNANWMILCSGGSFLFRGNNPATSFTTAIVADNAWHQGVLTITGTTAIWYTDGVTATSAGTVSAISNGTTEGLNNLAIGAVEPGQSFFFKGNLAHVALYNAVLTPTQVSNHYLGLSGLLRPMALDGLGGTYMRDPLGV